ncbi:MAG: hypothetical protein HC853_00150 [Anaerolineae bacterium]|nr:hypothetical protein [Anaerolineae bacterium]
MSTKISTQSSAQSSVQNELFGAALSLVSKVPGTSTHPITKYIIVRLKGKTMVQVAKTSLGITVVKTVVANNEGEGVLAIDAKPLNEFAASLGKGIVGLRMAGKNLTLWNAAASAEFKGIGDEEFPKLEITKGCPVVKITAAHLKAAIGQVIFAAAADMARPTLAAVNWYMADKQLILAATDSFRLSEAKASLMEPISEAHTVLVPLAAMRIIESALGDGEVVEVALCEGKIVVTCGHTIVHAQLLAEKFVDYKAFIPKVACQAQVPRDALIRTLKSVAIFHDTVDVGLSKKQVQLSAVGAEVGSGRAVVPMEGFKGEPQTFRAQARLVWRPLESLEVTSVMVGAGGSNKAILIKPKGDTSGVTSLHVVMPFVSTPPQAAPKTNSEVQEATAEGSVAAETA